MKMLTNNQIIVKNYDEIVKITKRYVNGNYYNDFQQELFIIILSQNNDRLNELYYTNQLMSFVVGIIKNQWYSQTSNFYNKYKKYDKNKTELKEYDTDED